MSLSPQSPCGKARSPGRTSIRWKLQQKDIKRSQGHIGFCFCQPFRVYFRFCQLKRHMACFFHCGHQVSKSEGDCATLPRAWLQRERAMEHSGGQRLSTSIGGSRAGSWDRPYHTRQGPDLLKGTSGPIMRVSIIASEEAGWPVSLRWTMIVVYFKLKWADFTSLTRRRREQLVAYTGLYL